MELLKPQEMLEMQSRVQAKRRRIQQVTLMEH